MEKKRIQKIIQLAGLTEVESKIYVSLLELGPSLAGVISRRSGIHRRSVYDVIDRLIEKGLASYITKNNRKYFAVTNPTRFKEIIEEKQEGINKIIPELQEQFNFSKEKEETSFFRGIEGVKSVFEDQLNQTEEILVFGASLKANDILKYYFPHYDKRRASKKLKTRLIFNEEDKKDKRLKEIPLKDIKFLPKEYSGLTATCIYGDKLAIIIWLERPISVVIKNKQAADSYRKYFELLWNIAKD